MAIELRYPKSKDRVKVYRTVYDPAAKRGKSAFLGSMPNGATAIPDSILVQLSDVDRADLEAKLGLTETAASAAAEGGYGLEETIAALAAFAEAAPTMLVSDRQRLSVAAKAMLTAFSRIGVMMTIGGIDYVERGDGKLTVLDNDGSDPFTIPTPMRKAAPGEQVYRTDDEGRIVTKNVLAESTSDGLPVPSDGIIGKVSDTYSGIDVNGLVTEWHDTVRSHADRYAGWSQSAVDERFFFDAAGIVRRRLRAQLPAISDRDGFDREAEGLAWEHSLKVNGEILRYYARILDGNAPSVWMPKACNVADDLRVWQSTPERHRPAAPVLYDTIAAGGATGSGDQTIED